MGKNDIKAFPRYARTMERVTTQDVATLAIKRIQPLLLRAVTLNLSKGGTAQRGEGIRIPKNLGPHLRVINNRLRASWFMHPVRRVGLEVSGKLSSDVVYSVIHEYGGIAGRGVLIPARPYIRPAIAEVRPAALRIMREETDKANRGAL